jgi:hypothetical protein
VNDVSWGALAFSLTVLGGIYTWWALRRRGVVAAVRGAGLTLLPIAAWLTGLLKVFGSVGDAVGTWVTGLVFNPRTWIGVLVFFVAVVLIGGANLVSRRTSPAAPASRKERRALAKGKAPKSQPVVDDEMAEIEAMLKRRGIS